MSIKDVIKSSVYESLGGGTNLSIMNILSSHCAGLSGGGLYLCGVQAEQ